jgi:thioredoxin 2
LDKAKPEVSMPLIRTCKNRGRKNRVPAAHLADTGRCGACHTPLPPVDEPLEVDSQLFDEIIKLRARSGAGGFLG